MNTMNRFSDPQNSSLTQAVLEGFVDGVLLMTEQGKLVYANAPARRMCQLMNRSAAQTGLLPKAIWQNCQTLIEGRNLQLEPLNVVESTIVVNPTTEFRVRARWFSSPQEQGAYVIVMLEDRYQALQHLAIAEAQRYRLTRRETEIWVLRRHHYTRKEIAERLHVTLDTVKKHLKNIHAKRQMESDAMESLRPAI
jgi:DNA-binding CsgD family transcriptional regulator